MTAVIDYDAGNIRSVEKALLQLGDAPVITRDPEVIRQADRLILPGVGAFGDAMDRLNAYGLTPVIRRAAESGKPFLGICLGQQLLFESSEESPGVQGLGILKGQILKIPADKGLKIPHIGWNSLEIKPGADLYRGLEGEIYTYFVHSYYLPAENPAVCAVTEYAVRIGASVQAGNIYACQFHPEKSSENGLVILKNFLSL